MFKQELGGFYTISPGWSDGKSSLAFIMGLTPHAHGGLVVLFTSSVG